MNAKQNIALIGIFVFFMLLFNAPFLSLPTGVFHNVPSIIIYIGTAWVVLIILMILFSSKTKAD